MKRTTEEHPHALKFIPLQTTPEIEHELNRARRAIQDIHNKTVKHAQKLINTLDNNKQYQNARKTYTRCKKKLETKLSKEDRKKTSAIKQQAANTMNQIRTDLGLTDYGLQTWANNHRMKKYSKIIDSNAAMKEGNRVWKSVEKYLFKGGKAIHCKKWDDMHTIGAKTATSGVIPVRDENDEICAVKWRGHVMPFSRELNEYERAALENKVRYVDLEFLLFPDGYHYYVIFNLKGQVPTKHDKGKGKVGIDAGTSTMAIDSDTATFMELLTPDAEGYDDIIEDLSRRIDQSMRATNPDRYNEDGTYKKGSGKGTHWVLSDHCKRLKRERRMWFRKQHESMVCSHSRLANRVVSLGDEFVMEEMNYAGLAKRAALARDSATGRYKKRNRWGKSIAHRAPATFIAILSRKCDFLGCTIWRVNNRTFKASQLDHSTGECVKASLSERWKRVDGKDVQRDMYSAFLQKHAAPGGKFPLLCECVRDFEKFVERMDAFVEYARVSGIPRNSCFGF